MFAHTILEGRKKGFRSKNKMEHTTTSDLYITFRKAPQPDTSDLPSKTYKHDNKVKASNIARRNQEKKRKKKKKQNAMTSIYHQGTYK